MPDEAAGLVRVEAGRADDLLDARTGRRRPGPRRRVAGEQRRRHHVDPDVGGLGRQDRGRQELERVSMVELAPRVRVLDRQPPRHLAGPTLRGAGPPRPRAVGSGGGHRRRRLRRGPAGATGSLPAVRRLEIKRQMTPTDIAEVSGLLAAAERADGHRPLDDHAVARPGRGRAARASPASSPWEPGHDHPVAYAQVSRGNDSWGLELVVDPHHRYEMATIGPELLGAAVDVVAAEGGGHVHWWVFEPTTAHDELARAVGLTPGRVLHQMRRPLPLDEHTDLVTRPFRAGRGRGGVARRQQPRLRRAPRAGRAGTCDTLAAREKEPWFDPAGFLPARARRPAGRLLLDEGARRPRPGPRRDLRDRRRPRLPRPRPRPGPDPRRARPPGRAGRRPSGCSTSTPTTPRPLGLYRSLGFTVHRTDRAYTGDIPG